MVTILMGYIGIIRHILGLCSGIQGLESEKLNLAALRFL